MKFRGFYFGGSERALMSNQIDGWGAANFRIGAKAAGQ